MFRTSQSPFVIYTNRWQISNRQIRARRAGRESASLVWKSGTIPFCTQNVPTVGVLTFSFFYSNCVYDWVELGRTFCEKITFRLCLHLTKKNICMLLQLKDYLISTFINLILKLENLPYRESIGFSEKG